MTGRRGERRSEAVKTGDDVPEPPKPSKAIDASDATVAARAPSVTCIAVASDSAGEDTFMIDASYVVKKTTISVKRADQEPSPYIADLIEPAPPAPVCMCSQDGQKPYKDRRAEAVHGAALHSRTGRSSDRPSQERGTKGRERSRVVHSVLGFRSRITRVLIIGACDRVCTRTVAMRRTHDRRLSRGPSI